MVKREIGSKSKSGLGCAQLHAFTRFTAFTQVSEAVRYEARIHRRVARDEEGDDLGRMRAEGEAPPNRLSTFSRLDRGVSELIRALRWLAKRSMWNKVGKLEGGTATCMDARGQRGGTRWRSGTNAR